MSTAMDIFCLDVPFNIIFDAVLYVATVVGGCGWTIPDREVRMDIDFWQFPQNSLNFASVADAMTFLMILNSTCTGPFSGVIAAIGMLLLGFGTRKNYPPALLHDYGFGI